MLVGRVVAQRHILRHQVIEFAFAVNNPTIRAWKFSYGKHRSLSPRL
jgi:hypothetical protein